MKKRLIITIIIFLILITAFIIYSRFKERAVIENSDFSKIYNDFESMYESNILSEKIKLIENEKASEIFNLLKDEIIYPVHFWEYDNIRNGGSYKFIVVSNKREYILNISNNNIVIGKNIYFTKENLYEKINRIY